MAHISGHVGDIRWRPIVSESITISFADTGPDTILDSGDGFVTAGIAAGFLYTVSGSGANDGNYTVDSVLAGTLTLASAATLTAEGAGATVTIIAALPGVQLGGFFTWTLDYTGEALDTTDFNDSGWRTFIPGIKGFTATCEKFWTTAENENAWLATTKLVRFFERYDATPSITNAYYHEGSLVITGISPVVSVDGGPVTQTMTMTGTGALTFNTRTTPWPVAGE